MATVVSGARTTVAGMASSRQKVDMADLWKLEDEQGALIVTMNLMGKKPAMAVSVDWHTTELRPKFDAIDNGAGYTPGDTVLAVDNASYFRSKDLIKNTRTGELMLVLSVAAPNITVERSVGSTAAAAMNDDDELMIVRTAYGENQSLESARSVTEVLYSNNMGLSRTNFEISGTHRAIGKAGGHYHGADEITQRELMMLTHKRDLNLSLLHEEKGAAAADSTQRSIDGVITFVKDNGVDRTNSVATLTETEWNKGLKDAFRYGSSRKVAIMSRGFAGIVNEFGASVQRTKPKDRVFGLRLTDYVSPHGDISMITDHGLEGEEYDKYCVIVDTGKNGGPKMRVLRDTMVLRDRQNDDQDGYEEEILTEQTAEWGHPDFHYIFDSVTA